MFALVAALLAGAVEARAACRAVSAHDGDTLTVACDAGVQQVRLREIDAPELAQPYGRTSRDALRRLCVGRSVELTAEGLDRYGRTLARVRCRGRDASLHQVLRGMAWGYTRYLTDASIAIGELEARHARRGLWRGKSPVPPWEYRLAKGSA